MSRILLRPMAAGLIVAGVALAPGCRPLSYYLSNTSFTVTSTPGSYIWNQSDPTDAPNGSWSPTVTEPTVHIANVMGSNVSIVALVVTPTYISSQFGGLPSPVIPQVYPINVELSSGASGSSSFDYTLTDMDSTMQVATLSTPINTMTSTVSAPDLQYGQGTNGTFEFEVVPLWKNAFNQTNFSGTLDAGNLAITNAAENNDVPSPRSVVEMDVQYNLAGTNPAGTTTSGGGGGSSGGGSPPVSGGVK